MTKHQNANHTPDFRPASKHELQVVAPEAAIRNDVVTLATVNINRAYMAAKPANNASAFLASSPERVGGVASVSFVEPPNQVTPSVTDSIIADVPELAYAEHIDRRDADAAHEAESSEAVALQAVNEASMAAAAERAMTQRENYFTNRDDAPIGNPLTPQVGYIEDVADFAATQAQEARQEIDTLFKDQQAA